MVRLKNRYLVVEVTWKDGKIDDSCTDQLLLQAIRDSVAQNFGDHGLGSSVASLQVKYFSPYTGLAIVRCATAEHEKVITALTFTSEVKQRPAAVRLLRLSGTLAAGKEAALQLSAARLQGAVAAPKLSKQQLAAAEQLHRQLPSVEL
ncbi:hypothetical protein PLESTF_000833500 [Pleodorina starrii]|nr:hypothetical protein PLESTM_000900300 [Pleodorina starrii]GLC69463.1 hypothetical protein PLESTF_000833500 [Pleodorina starrii]